MDLVDDLVLVPFKEIVEKANTAVENAGDDNPDMLKASQALVKEGQRALKRIEPLCKKHYEEYSSNFTDALKENDEIAEYRAELNDFLWEFDDYIEVDDFDAEEFTKLQKLSRKAAPRMYDIIMRMKLEPAPAQVPAPSVESEKSSPTKEQQPATVVDGAANGAQVELPPLQTTVLQRGRSATTPPTVSLPGPPPRRSLPVTPVDAGPVGPAEAPVPPAAPMVNPWDIKTKPAAYPGFHAARATSPTERRRPTIPSQADLALLPQVEAHHRPHEMQQQSPRYSQASLDSLVKYPHAPHDPHRRYSPLSQESQKHSQQPPLSPSSTSSSQPMNESPTLGMAQPVVSMHGRSRISGFPPTTHRPLGHSIPEDATVQALGQATMRPPSLPPPQYVERYSGGSNPPGANLSRQHSLDSFRSSMHGASSSVGDNRTSGLSANESSSMGSPVFSQGAAPGTPASPSSRHSAGLQGLPPVGERENEGLIPVEPDGERNRQFPGALPPRDTSITLSSSFYLLKGFCEGAKEVVRGELGVKKVKKPTFTGSQLTAKCTHCFYELDWREIELDINQSSDANFAIGNVGFRIRFLQKSHLPTRRADEPVYACVFCVQEGHTAQDGDATVFFAQRELCEHLARHHRPLPHVPGITVVDEPQIPTGMRTGYDVHLREPRTASLFDDKWAEIASLPMATAKTTVKKMYGMKLLHDRTPAFELAIGAKIIGVQFPEKYGGEWAMGYHDGKYASFPLDVATLEPPPPHELRMGGMSTVRAVARWKFVIKDKTKAEWLRFERGDVISNINWSESEHWCWSGTNPKGKWGIFPKSHLDLQTLRENDDSDRSSSISGSASVKPKSLLGRMKASRKSDDRPSTPAADPPAVQTVTSGPDRKFTPQPSYYHLAAL